MGDWTASWHQSAVRWRVPDRSGARRPKASALIFERSQASLSGRARCSVRERGSATAANAFDLAVEHCVFLVQRIIRIARVLLRRQLIGARLTMADWRLAS